jgi:hypothetical protein
MLGAVAGSVLGGSLKPEIAAFIADWKQDVRDLREAIGTAKNKPPIRAQIELLQDRIKAAVNDPANYANGPIQPEGVTPGLINPIGPAATYTNAPLTISNESSFQLPNGTFNPSANFDTSLFNFDASSNKNGDSKDDKPPLAKPPAAAFPWGLAALVVGAVYLASRK